MPVEKGGGGLGWAKAAAAASLGHPLMTSAKILDF